METVTITEAWPDYGEGFTLADLDRMPDDGHRYELNLKKAAYERYGVPCYWVADPDLDRPALRAFELSDGAYREVAHVAGDQAFHARQPFAVHVTPAHLIAKLRRA